MPRPPKCSIEMSESQIMKASREHFSKYGYHAARMSDIAEESGVNKRLVYEIISDKENLYMAVLSEVSREFEASFSTNISGHAMQRVADVYRTAFAALCKHDAFSRLLAWEWMCETIQGARILAVAKRIREKIHAEALRVEPACSTRLAKYDLALEALVLRYAMMDAPSPLNREMLDALAEVVFSVMDAP